MLERYLYALILQDLKKKMVFLTGPRQVGKTFLAKKIMGNYSKPLYLNYDASNDRKVILAQSWEHSTDLLIFDEIHKLKKWKLFLKGIYDTKPAHLNILVTGSARLETFSRGGDSLAGRYFHFRLYPISIKEYLPVDSDTLSTLEKLNRVGGFPEPFLNVSSEEGDRWRRQYFSQSIREDVLEISRIHEIKNLQILLEMLRERVGSPLSYQSLANDLHLAPNTVRSYVRLLEALYLIFLVYPFHRNIARAIQKEPKIYFYDTGYLPEDKGIRLENTCALSLLKHVHYLQDQKGRNIDLHYLRTKDGYEVDFAIAEQNALTQLIEIKSSDDSPSSGILYFAKRFPHVPATQWVQNLKHPQQIKGISVVHAAEALSGLDA